MQDEIFGSAYASVAYLKYILNFPSDKRVYIIGEEGMEHELASEGIQYAGGTVCTFLTTSAPLKRSIAYPCNLACITM